MSLLWRSQRAADPSIPPGWAQYSTAGARRGESAMYHSAVWAAVRLRADLVSTMPLDAFRKMPDGVRVPIPSTPVLLRPSPQVLSMREWLYMTQMDLDRYGNTFGRIMLRDNLGFPARIDLVDATSVSVRVVGGKVEYWFGSELVDTNDVWHERQYSVAGSPVGLSPVAYAALSVDLQRSALEFARDWFSGGVQMPNGVLRNTAKILTADEANVAKSRFTSNVRAGEPMVTGKDWEFSPLSAETNDAAWLSSQNATAVDVARFFGVPGDMIDAPQPGASITYANVTQRNLQLLIINIGPAVGRREDALSTLLADPRFVKLNTDALLRMDPQTRSQVLGQQIKDRITAPSEARRLMDREPFTDEQLAEFDALFKSPLNTTPSLVEAVQKVYLGVGKVITEDEARVMLNELGANLTVPAPSQIGGAA